MRLTELLTGLGEDDQGTAARGNVASASLEELLDALDLEPLGEWAFLHITYELAQRGVGIIAPIRARLVARPTRNAAYGLGEVLIELFRGTPEAESAVVHALIEAGEEALRVGTRSLDAKTYIIHLADCARMAARTLSEARPLALAFLQRAQGEAEPDRFTVDEARFLVGGEPGGASGGSPR